jgi:hypothetical protein
MAKYLIFILLSGCASTSDVRVIESQIDILQNQVNTARESCHDIRSRLDRDEGVIDTLEELLSKKDHR